MEIRFLCPNGHGLSSPENKAGGYGKCPTCAVPFQVPIANSPGDELRRAEAVINFKCPDGHPLRVSARMSGQSGNCPTCEKPFRVPAAPKIVEDAHAPLMEVAEDDAQHGGIVLDLSESDVAATATPEDSKTGLPRQPSQPPGSVGGHVPRTTDHDDPVGLQASQNPAVVGSIPLEQQTHITPVIGPPVIDSPHPMTALFEALWDGTQRDAIVDVYHGENERISPQHYAHELSHGQHAVFSVMEENETHTLYLIPWDRIHRVAIRELTELPPGMFD